MKVENNENQNYSKSIKISKSILKLKKLKFFIFRLKLNSNFCSH